MTATIPADTRSTPSLSPGLPLLAVAGAVLGFAVLQLAALRIAGVFEYPLDDVYIHLAMASGMAGGTYGVNAGEAASAASSILYPVLLMPWPGAEAQRLLPLVWNLVGLCLSAGFWGTIVAQANLPRWLAVGLAAIGPVLLNMPGVAFLGMEHSLHTAASLGTVLGLVRWLQGGRVTPLFVASVVLAPMFRLEGLALSLGAAAAVAMGGQWRAGLALGFGALLPVLGFMAGLMALGLPPLPSSVLVKLATVQPGTGVMEGMLLKVVANLHHPAGIVLAVVTAVALAGLLAVRLGRRRPGSAQASVLLAVLLAAGVAHLVEGQVGWLHRYEHYIIVSMLGGLLLAGAMVGGAVRAALVPAVVVLILAAGLAWLPRLLTSYLWNPRAIHLQQAQMGRFAQDFAREPVAVNDLGRVVWNNPDHVLDLWGLASDRARRLRLDAPPPDGWADLLVQERGVRLAMVYDRWIGRGIGPGWVRIGRLSMVNPRGVLGDYDVSIYATTPEAAPELAARLRAFAPTLPVDARLTIGTPVP